jgi:hypothetical protein
MQELKRVLETRAEEMLLQAQQDMQLADQRLLSYLKPKTNKDEL